MFAVGQTVRLVNGGDTDEGRVIAVWPAIGMVDVQFPHTNYRLPVEDVHILNPGQDQFIAPMHETVPGGAGSAAEVSTGKKWTDDLISKEPPLVQLVKQESNGESVEKTAELSVAQMAARVARAHVKKALYWNGRDRKYRCTQVEGATSGFGCPKKGCLGVLKPAVYKRVDGASVKLLGCPKCMFLIKRSDILDGAPVTEEVAEAV
jgi:hypothetical protein